jgi:hypothetical protein
VLSNHNLFTCKKKFLMQEKCACACQVQLQMFCAIWWQACMFDVKLSHQVLMQQEKLFLLFPCALILQQQSGLRWLRCPPLDQANALAKGLEGFMFSFYLCFYFIAYLISICVLLVCFSIVVFPPSFNKFPLLPLNSTIGLQKDIVIERLNFLQVMVLILLH